MKILVKKYTWLDTELPEDVNFFSTATPVIAPAVDIYPFMIEDSLGRFKYKMENLDAGDNKLYLEIPNVSYKLSNLKEYQTYQYMADFFGVARPAERQKFSVKITGDANENLFDGFIYKSSVNFPNRANEELDVLNVGLEKEWVEYFSNKSLEEVSFNTSFNFPFPGLQTANLADVIRQNFTNSQYTINISSEIEEYSIVKNPYLYAPIETFTNNTLFFKTGYDSFRRANCSKFDWFNSVCISMGFVWGFYDGELFVRNRVDVTLPVHNIDYNRTFINHGIENTLLDKSVDNVIINDGQFFSNKAQLINLVPLGSDYYPFVYLGGERRRVFSEANFATTNVTPFLRIDFNISRYQVIFNNRTLIYEKEISNSSKFTNWSLNESGVLDAFPYPYNYRNDATLNLTPYVLDLELGAGINLEFARRNIGGQIGNPPVNNIGYGNFYIIGDDYSDEEFYYTGHAGNSIYKYNSDSEMYETYDDYCLTETFSNNFRKFLRTSEQTIIPVELGELITNPFQRINVTNYPYADINNRPLFSQGLEFDYKAEKSFMKLQLNPAT